MNTLKLIRLAFIQMIQAAWSLPKTISNAHKLRQERIVMKEFQAERLDRIRNPEKYRGK
jgi:hypothetical protein